MMRYAIILSLLFSTTMSFGQLDLAESDSLTQLLEDSIPSEKDDHIEVNPNEGDMLINWIEYPPLYKTCVGITLSERKECLNEEVQSYIKNEIKIPKELRDSAFTATVFVSFLVEQSSEMTKIEVSRSSSFYLSNSMKPLAYLLDEEAVRVISKLKFIEPGVSQNKPIRMMLTIPVRYSNPGK